MPDVNEPTDWEKRYKDTQTDYTRATQELAEHRRKMEQGELVDRGSYESHVKDWASKNPDAAREWLGLQGQPAASQEPAGADAGRRTGGFSSIDDEVQAHGDEAFDPQSEVYKRLLRKYCEDGVLQAYHRRYGRDVLAATEIPGKLTTLEKGLEETRAQLQEALERAKRAEEYSIAGFNKSRILEDPRLKDIQEIQQKLEKDPNYWFEVREKMKLAEKVPSSPVPAPEKLAEQVQHAQGTPAGSGPASGSADSPATDPFDAAVQFAEAQLAGAR